MHTSPDSVSTVTHHMCIATNATNQCAGPVGMVTKYFTKRQHTVKVPSITTNTLHAHDNTPWPTKPGPDNVGPWSKTPAWLRDVPQWLTNPRSCRSRKWSRNHNTKGIFRDPCYYYGTQSRTPYNSNCQHKQVTNRYTHTHIRLDTKSPLASHSNKEYQTQWDHG